jgi:transcriptional regulator with XRE-family HTH domain
MEEKADLAKMIGSNLKSLRKQGGLTLKQLATMTKLSPPLLSKIENGLTMPSVPTLLLISETLKVTIGFFFEQEEEKRYVVSREGSRRIEYSKRGSRGREITYESELLTEGMENPFMQPMIMTVLARRDEDINTVTHESR